MGFGDRLGLATPGHLAAVRKFPVGPVFAQQSTRELEHARRTPQIVLHAAMDALFNAGYLNSWGADADHIKTLPDIERAAAAGFTRYTLDAAAHIENRADAMDKRTLEHALAVLVNEGVMPADWRATLTITHLHLPDHAPIAVADGAWLRAAVKFARAVAHFTRLARHVHRLRGASHSEIEISLDEAALPTSAVEHAFVVRELKQRGIQAVAIAPRFSGGLFPGVDYTGDRALFEGEFRTHVAIARHFGPHQISLHNGSDKFSIYPAIGRIAGSLLHVKTSGTSWLEGLRLVARRDAALFREILAFSTTPSSNEEGADPVPAFPTAVDAEISRTLRVRPESTLDIAPLRTRLHQRFGSIVHQGVTGRGQPFGQAIRDTLLEDPAGYREHLDAWFSRHLACLTQG